jgi:hypothetical protein
MLWNLQEKSFKFLYSSEKVQIYHPCEIHLIPNNLSQNAQNTFQTHHQQKIFIINLLNISLSRDK